MKRMLITLLLTYAAVSQAFALIDINSVSQGNLPIYPITKIVFDGTNIVFADGANNVAVYPRDRVRSVMLFDGTDTAVKNADAIRVMAYPNPASDIIKIEGISDSADYIIMDINGKLIDRGHGNTINVRTLQRGTYILNIENINIKFIKQ